MQDARRSDLCKYRMQNALESLEVAQDCFEKSHYKDAINRSYYAAFYAIKAVLALEEKDFKRHKDVVAYFNKAYVAVNIFPKEIGRKIARLQQKREKSDYDDFYIATREETIEQLEYAKTVICEIERYLDEQ